MACTLPCCLLPPATEPGTWSPSLLEDDLFLQPAPGSLLDGTQQQQQQQQGEDSSSSSSPGLQALSLDGVLAEARRAVASSSPATAHAAPRTTGVRAA